MRRFVMDNGRGRESIAERRRRRGGLVNHPPAARSRSPFLANTVQFRHAPGSPLAAGEPRANGTRTTSRATF